MGRESAIGVFDSGVGGLTVVREMMSTLPNENIIYFGDTARVPYGSKTQDEITRCTKQIVRFLLSKNVKALIIACNTISAACLNVLKNEFDIPIIEVIAPGAKGGVNATKSGRIGVIATESTIKSGAYERQINALNPDVQVSSKFCPLFVPLVEEGWTHNDVTQLTVNIYVEELRQKGIDTLIMGCTHYPLLRDCLHKALPDVTLVNPAEITALDIKELLEKTDMLNESNIMNNVALREFFVSGDTGKFAIAAEKILGEKIDVKKVDIGIY